MISIYNKFLITISLTAKLSVGHVHLFPQPIMHLSHDGIYILLFHTIKMFQRTSMGAVFTARLTA